MTPEDSIWKAIEKMSRERVHRILIEDKENEIYLSSSAHKDFLIYLIQKFKGYLNESLNIPVRTLSFSQNMPEITTIESNDSVYNTFQTMLERGLSALPILKENLIIGFVFKKDI